MKAVSTGLLLLLVCVANGQTKYYSRSSSLTFTSAAKLELIKAATDQVSGVIDPASKEFAFLVKISSFKGFNSELQRAHFNEKYLESEEYPNASFTGKIIDEIDFTKYETFEVRAKGDLVIHGQKQTRIIKSKVTITEKTISIESIFIVPLADHNIVISKIVNQKIATEIDVHFTMVMALK